MIYADPRHAAALVAARGPGHAALPVAAWGGAALLRRPVPGGGADLAGPYPLLPFDPGWDIRAGLAELRAGGALSLVAAADPVLACPDPDAFDLARPYKRHHLVRGAYRPSDHHRAEFRRAARRCEVAELSYGQVLDDWIRLYAGLAAAKGIGGGERDFGPAYHHALAALAPRAFAAIAGGAVVAVAVWLRQGDMAWYHLAASDAAGRAASAGYAVVDAAIRALLAEGVACLVLGGGLAEADAPPCGLDRFKAGFATASRVNLLLGAVLDPAGCAARGGATGGAVFPAYRAAPARRSAA